MEISQMQLLNCHPHPARTWDKVVLWQITSHCPGNTKSLWCPQRKRSDTFTSTNIRNHVSFSVAEVTFKTAFSAVSHTIHKQVPIQSTVSVLYSDCQLFESTQKFKILEAAQGRWISKGRICEVVKGAFL